MNKTSIYHKLWVVSPRGCNWRFSNVGITKKILQKPEISMAFQQFWITKTDGNDIIFNTSTHCRKPVISRTLSGIRISYRNLLRDLLELHRSEIPLRFFFPKFNTWFFFVFLPGFVRNSFLKSIQSFLHNSCWIPGGLTRFLPGFRPEVFTKLLPESFLCFPVLLSVFGC